MIEEFATKQGVDFYPAGRGIGHQVTSSVLSIENRSSGSYAS